MEDKEFYVKMIKQFLIDCGIKPEDALLEEEDDHMRWVIHNGSVHVYIYLTYQKDKQTIRVLAPLVYIPPKNILPLYRACLENNFDLLNCSICVVKDTVALVSERHLEGLDPQELGSIIVYISNVADYLDNKLAEGFGALIVSENPR